MVYTILYQDDKKGVHRKRADTMFSPGKGGAKLPQSFIDDVTRALNKRFPIEIVGVTGGDFSWPSEEAAAEINRKLAQAKAGETAPQIREPEHVVPPTKDDINKASKIELAQALMSLKEGGKPEVREILREVSPDSPAEEIRNALIAVASDAPASPGKP